MKSIFTQIFAVFLIILAVSTAVIWEFYLDDKINTVVVLQAAKQIPRGHKVTSGDFVPLRVKMNAVPDGVINNITAIVNKETVTPINKGIIAVKDFFDDPDVVADANEMIAPIPDQWIYSLPGSLRRRDKVSIYQFPTSPQQILNSASQKPILNQNSPAELNDKGEPLFKNISVAFAKDSANQEVKPSNIGTILVDNF